MLLVCAMAVRSRMTVDPRIPTIHVSGRGTSGFHDPGAGGGGCSSKKK